LKYRLYCPGQAVMVRAAAVYLNSCKRRRPSPLSILSSRGHVSISLAHQLPLHRTRQQMLIIRPQPFGKTGQKALRFPYPAAFPDEAYTSNEPDSPMAKTTAPRSHQMEYSDDEIQGSDSTQGRCSHQGFSGWFKQCNHMLGTQTTILCGHRVPSQICLTSKIGDPTQRWKNACQGV
jgi:hypothetical protein